MFEKGAAVWRDSPFEKDHWYKVIKEFRQPQSIFSLGELLIYECAEYSHYDNATIFFFKTKGGHPKQWWLFDEQDLNEHKSLFAEMPE